MVDLTSRTAVLTTAGRATFVFSALFDIDKTPYELAYHFQHQHQHQHQDEQRPGQDIVDAQ